MGRLAQCSSPHMEGDWVRLPLCIYTLLLPDAANGHQAAVRRAAAVGRRNDYDGVEDDLRSQALQRFGSTNSAHHTADAVV